MDGIVLLNCSKAGTSLKLQKMLLVQNSNQFFSKQKLHLPISPIRYGIETTKILSPTPSVKFTFI